MVIEHYTSRTVRNRLVRFYVIFISDFLAPNSLQRAYKLLTPMTDVGWVQEARRRRTDRR